MISSNLASKITVMTYSKANIPIVAGDDFFANIPVDIETSAYRWVFPILSDITGDNSTKINISTCIWQNGQVHIKGNNQATGTANISLSGLVIATLFIFATNATLDMLKWYCLEECLL